MKCREELEQALMRRGFSYDESLRRWIRYPAKNAAGKAVVVAQDAVEEMSVVDWPALLDEVDGRIRESEARP